MALKWSALTEGAERVDLNLSTSSNVSYINEPSSFVGVKLYKWNGGGGISSYDSNGFETGIMTSRIDNEPVVIFKTNINIKDESSLQSVLNIKWDDLAYLIDITDSTLGADYCNFLVKSVRQQDGTQHSTAWSLSDIKRKNLFFSLSNNTIYRSKTTLTNCASQWLQVTDVSNDRSGFNLFARHSYNDQIVMCDMYTDKPPKGVLVRDSFLDKYMITQVNNDNPAYIRGPIATIDGKRYQTYGYITPNIFPGGLNDTVSFITKDYVGIAVSQNSLRKGNIVYTDSESGDTMTVTFVHNGIASRTDAHRIDVSSQINGIVVRYKTNSASKRIFKTPLMLGIKSNAYSRTIFFASANIMSYTLMGSVGDAINSVSIPLGDAPMAPGPSVVLQEYVAPYVNVIINDKEIGLVPAQISGSTMSFILPSEYYVWKNVNYDKWPYTEFKK